MLVLIGFLADLIGLVHGVAGTPVSGRGRLVHRIDLLRVRSHVFVGLVDLGLPLLRDRRIGLVDLGIDRLNGLAGRSSSLRNPLPGRQTPSNETSSLCLI